MYCDGQVFYLSDVRYVKSSKYLKANLMQTTNLVVNRSNCGSKFQTLTNVIWFRDDFISVHQDLFWFKETNWLLVNLILKSNEFIIKIYVNGRADFGFQPAYQWTIEYATHKGERMQACKFVHFMVIHRCIVCQSFSQGN